MAFWGIEIKPGKPYAHRHDDEGGRLHVSQATLGTGSSTKKSIVQCNVGDKRPIYLCSLLPEKLETCPLNLEFEEEDEVTFSVIGPHSIHLSGFFHGESQENFGDDYGPDSYEEDIVEIGSESDESTDYDTEDESEDDFIDDDLEMYPPSPVPNIGVIIEEIFDDEKPTNENGKRSKKRNNWLSGSEDNNDSQRQIVVKRGTAVPVLESEDEDGFPISSPRKSTNTALNAKANAEEIENKRTGEEVGKKKEKDAPDRTKNLKRKIDAVGQDDEKARKNGQPLNSSVPTAEMVPENDVKQKKKNKKNKAKAEEGKVQPEDAITRDMDQAPPVEKEYNQKLTNTNGVDIDADFVADKIHSNDKEKKKKRKKNKKQESSADANAEQTVTDKNGSSGEVEEKAEVKPFQVRSFPNGLVIEELEMGKPDGKKASPGKKVSVHYIGKLKKNGKIFDSNIGRAPFKFRLGVGQVIKGWDVGVNGMRVGDKRRLTIPPAMGYGARGAGGDIPPNSWLIFDVELVDVS